MSLSKVTMFFYFFRLQRPKRLTSLGFDCMALSSAILGLNRATDMQNSLRVGENMTLVAERGIKTPNFNTLGQCEPC